MLRAAEKSAKFHTTRIFVEQKIFKKEVPFFRNLIYGYCSKRKNSNLIMKKFQEIVNIV